jgi:hypothetical protein
MYKKLMLRGLGVLAMCLVVGFWGPALRAEAPPTSDLIALARHFPADTVFFAALNTSQAVIEDTDSVLDLLKASVPGLVPADVDVEAALVEAFGASTWAGLRAWLGDSAALGVIGAESLISSTPNILLAAEVTDPAAARAFLETTLLANTERYTESELGDYTLFTDSAELNQGHVLLGDDVLFISTVLDDLTTRVARGDFVRLSDSDDFTATLALLPATGYHGLFYLDTSAVLSLSMDAMLSNQPTIDGMFEAIIDSQVRQAFGLTLLGERSLTFDFASNIGNYAALEAFFSADDVTLPDLGAVPAIDPAFARHLPASTQFVIQGAGLGPQLVGFFDTLSVYGELFSQVAEEQMMMNTMGGLAAGSFPEFDWGGLAQGSLTTLFAGLTGLHLEDEVLSWMTGDFALFLSLIPVETELTLSLDMGFITANTDPAAVDNVIATLTQTAERYGLTNSVQTAGETTSLILPQLVRGLFPPDFMVSREVLDATPELDIVIGANAEVFIVASRPGAAFALSPEGETLADTAAYAYAAENLFVPGGQAVYYISFDALAGALRATGLDAIYPGMGDVMRLLDTLESATASTVSISNAQSVGRLTITLAAR